MTTVYDVPADRLIEKLAEELEGNESLTPASWASFVKTGVHNERPPEQKNWWYIRAASLLRRIYIEGPVGVHRLCTYYGGIKNNGHKPEGRRSAGGSIIRTLLQQLQAAGYVETTPKGRIITPQGKAFLDKLSTTLKTSLESDMPELAVY
ncbi:30S ribosomal protein S19e [archaeon]|nr:MAG: 30S ribosomal protein S19e [archaeon]